MEYHGQWTTRVFSGTLVDIQWIMLCLEWTTCVTVLRTFAAETFVWKPFNMLQRLQYPKWRD